MVSGNKPPINTDNKDFKYTIKIKGKIVFMNQQKEENKVNIDQKEKSLTEKQG